MELNVNIDSEQINKMVSEAILNSLIGEALKEQIKKSISELSTSYNNPIKSVIDRHVKETISNIIQTDYKDTLKSMVKESMTDEVVGDLIHKSWKNITDRY